MSRMFKVMAMCLSLLSLVFVSCEKPQTESGEGEEVKKSCYFDAKVQMTKDFVDACESLTFEYKNAEGKKVSEKIDASKLKPAKYTNPILNIEMDVLEWTCKFDYKQSPAEVYFKPTVKFKESVSFQKEPDFIFYPKIYSGVHNSDYSSNYDKADLKLGVSLDDVSALLEIVARSINAIEVDTTVGK